MRFFSLLSLSPLRRSPIKSAFKLRKIFVTAWGHAGLAQFSKLPRNERGFRKDYEVFKILIQLNFIEDFQDFCTFFFLKENSGFLASEGVVTFLIFEFEFESIRNFENPMYCI